MWLCNIVTYFWDLSILGHFFKVATKTPSNGCTIMYVACLLLLGTLVATNFFSIINAVVINIPVPMSWYPFEGLCVSYQEARLSLQPYHPEHTSSLLKLEGKQGRTSLVPGWEATFKSCLTWPASGKTRGLQRRFCLSNSSLCWAGSGEPAIRR